MRSKALEAWLAGMLVLVACGDDTSGGGGAGGGNGGEPSNGGEAPIGGSGGEASTGGAGGEVSTGGAGGEVSTGGAGGGSACVDFGNDCTPNDVCCDAAEQTGECFAFGMGSKCTIPCPPNPDDCPNGGLGCNNMDPAVCRVPN